MIDSKLARNVVAVAVDALKQRIEEVNRLNVFPVPDGDTGTNMSLTLDAVLTDIAKLGDNASLEEVCKAATHGSLMGARGNSGVITSQIIRGACEGLLNAIDQGPAEALAVSLETATSVSYQAVRKPVEGTILTVIKDMATAARKGVDSGMSFEELLEHTVDEAFASVKRTPELLPVLKEAGVVDAGGFGLSIFYEGFVSAALGRAMVEHEVPEATTVLSVTPVDDWDDDEYLYCTEFLLFGETLDKESFHDFVASQGGSELVVGDAGQYKIHVHTNDPSVVLMEALKFGELAEVHIHNMRRQQAERPSTPKDNGPAKPIGIIAVSSGQGLKEIFESLGVDVVISGGQTMNPSTADFVKAAESINAESYILLPNNSNIILAAQSATEVLDVPSMVVPTRSIPEGFSALISYMGEGDLEEIAEEMSEAAGEIKTAEVTTAIKDAKGKVGEIKAGQVIGITNGKEIEAVGENIKDVVTTLLSKLVEDDDETVTLIVGEDLSDDEAKEIEEYISELYPEVFVEVHRGDQPLYPLLMSVE